MRYLTTFPTRHIQNIYLSNQKNIIGDNSLTYADIVVFIGCKWSNLYKINLSKITVN